MGASGSPRSEEALQVPNSKMNIPLHMKVFDRNSKVLCPPLHRYLQRCLRGPLHLQRLRLLPFLLKLQLCHYYVVVVLVTDGQLVVRVATCG